MISKYLLLPLILALFLDTGCSNKIGEHLISQISNSKKDSVIVKPDMALFIFKIDQKKSWSWHQKNIRIGQGEYGWWVDFTLDGKQYSCGYNLFKFSNAKPSKGSFEQLIKAGQTDLSIRKRLGKTNNNNGSYKITVLSQRVNDARVESIVQSDKLIILLEEQKIIDRFRKLRPDSVLYHRNTGRNKFERHKVAVTYSSK